MNLRSLWAALRTEEFYESRIIWSESIDDLAREIATFLNSCGGYGASCTHPTREDGAGVYESLVLYKVRKKKKKND